MGAKIQKMLYASVTICLENFQSRSKELQIFAHAEQKFLIWPKTQVYNKYFP